MGPKALAVGSEHACLLSGTGEVWCWGRNEEGELGDGTTVDRARPVQVRGLPGPALEIAAGPQHTCARVEGGKVLCWGSRMAAREHGYRRDPTPVVGLTPRTPVAAKDEARAEAQTDAKAP